MIHLIQASLSRAAYFLSKNAPLIETEPHWQTAKCDLGYMFRELQEAMRLTRRPRQTIRRRP